MLAFRLQIIRAFHQHLSNTQSYLRYTHVDLYLNHANSLTNTTATALKIKSYHNDIKDNELCTNKV